MSLTVVDAYARIKNLENAGQITLPEPQDTVEVGTIDPRAGTFTWSVPTVVQTTVLPPLPPGKTNTIINVTVGVVATKAVDLRLKFVVIPQPLVNHPVAMSEKVATATGTASAVGVVDGFAGETNGGVTITEFPTVSSAANQITIDVGLVCSTIIPNEATTTSPPVSNFGVTINFPGHDPITARFFILRPPVVGMGVFTIPALPMTIVYAPPQGKLLKNSATYSDTETLTRTVSSSITTTKNTKTAQAYSVGDLIGKVAAAIGTVAAVVGTGGAGAAGGASVAGALSQLGAALFGPIKEENDSTADGTKQLQSELSLVSNILTAVDSSTTSDAGTVATQNDHSLTLTLSSMSQYGSESALGPGVGDRIVYMSNVKVVWMVVNGEVGINVLGFDGIGANAVQDLVREQHSLANGGQPALGLDARTIKSLLSQDPLVPTKTSVVGHFGPPLVGPPRFVPARIPGRSGSGTGPGGDVIQESFDSATEDKQTTTSSQTTITDAKPGWAAVVFGGENVETTTTTTFTMSQSIDNKMDDKITSTITVFSAGFDDPYDVKIFYDHTFGTYAILNSDSPLLQGITVINQESDASPIGQLGSAQKVRR